MVIKAISVQSLLNWGNVANGLRHPKALAATEPIEAD